MTATQAATQYLLLQETDLSAAIALAHQFEDSATPEAFDEYLALLEKEG